MMLKIIAKGFFFNQISNKNAYIRDFWNVLDACVVISFILDYGLIKN